MGLKLSDIRAQFPMYKDVPDEQLLIGLHNKYYQDMPFKDFNAAIEYDNKPNAADGMSTTDKFLAGVGKSLHDTAQGLGQMVGLADRADVAESRRLGADLMNTTAGKVGDFAGNVVTTVPLAFVPGANTLKGAALIGAATGLAQPSTSTDETLSNTGLGAAAGAGGIAAGRALGAGYQAVTGLLRPMTEKGRNKIAAEILQASATDANKAVQNMASARALVPGSVPTVGQVADDAGLAQLERTLYNNPESQGPLARTYAQQATARMNALQGVAGDDAQIAALTAARNATTAPVYTQAKNANYFVDNKLDNLLSRPLVQKAMTRAQTIAENEGRPFGFTTTSSAPFSGVGGAAPEVKKSITGNSLQDLKMAMDDMLKDPSSGIVGKEATQARNLRGQIVDWIEGANPEFKAARQTYADMSRPINQMQIGQELVNKLQPALSDFGASGMETGATFARQLRNSDKLAANATGFKGAGTLESVMGPNKMATLNAIAQDLALKANGQNLGRAVGSPTMQNMLGQNLLQRIAGPLGVPTSFAQGVLASHAARPYEFVMKAAQPKILGALSEAMIDPTGKGAALLKLANQPSTLGRIASEAEKYMSIPGLIALEQRSQ